jgi:hypothetical protein
VWTSNAPSIWSERFTIEAGTAKTFTSHPSSSLHPLSILFLPLIFIVSNTHNLIPNPYSSPNPSIRILALPLTRRTQHFNGICKSLRCTSIRICPPNSLDPLQAPNHNRPYAQAAYSVPNGAPGAPANPVPGATPLLPNQGRVVQQGPVRVLCIADVRGKTVLLTKSPR